MTFFKKKPKDNWKNKAKERRVEIIKLEKRNQEIIDSREYWKTQAKKYKEKIVYLNNELKKNS
jgi:hypothetical protein